MRGGDHAEGSDGLKREKRRLKGHSHFQRKRMKKKKRKKKKKEEKIPKRTYDLSGLNTRSTNRGIELKKRKEERERNENEELKAENRTENRTRKNKEQKTSLK